MSDDIVLRAKAHEAIATGRIPNRRPDRVWGGLASRGCCAVCGVPLKSGARILEVEFARDDGVGPIKHDVHIRCYVELENEFGNREAIGAAAAAGEQPQSAPGACMASGLLPEGGT